MTAEHKPTSVSSMPYYQDDSVTIYHGDSIELVGDWRSWPVRIITDPPYGAGAYNSDHAPDIYVIGEWLEWTATAAFFGYPETLALWCSKLGVYPNEWVTWWPTNKATARVGRLIPRETEHIAIFGEICGADRLRRPRSVERYGRQRVEAMGLDPETARLGDVWRDPSPGAGHNFHLRQHPNEKPLSVMGNLVQLCSHPGDTIIDPFCGSGTTLVAAKAAGRRVIGVEIEERFCEIAAERCAQEVLILEALTEKLGR